jgi:hypothetical protein
MKDEDGAGAVTPPESPKPAADALRRECTLDSSTASALECAPDIGHSFKVPHMKRHTYVIRALLRQTGWLPFAGATDARAGALRHSIGGDRT